MKQLIYMIIGLGVAVSTKTARAQEGEIPQPKAPYLAPVPDYGHWAVTFKYNDLVASDNSKTPPPEQNVLPKTIDTIKTGELSGIVLTFASGASQQFTVQGDWVLTSTSNGPQLSTASTAHPPYPFYTPGFILLDGVTLNPSNFKEYTKYSGVNSFHYKSGDIDVWVDPETMLPIAVKQSAIEADYQFFAPPPRPFAIPKEQADLLRKEKEADRKIRAIR